MQITIGFSYSLKSFPIRLTKTVNRSINSTLLYCYTDPANVTLFDVVERKNKVFILLFGSKIIQYVFLLTCGNTINKSLAYIVSL